MQSNRLFDGSRKATRFRENGQIFLWNSSCDIGPSSGKVAHALFVTLAVGNMHLDRESASAQIRQAAQIFVLVFVLVLVLESGIIDQEDEHDLVADAPYSYPGIARHRRCFNLMSERPIIPRVPAAGEVCTSSPEPGRWPVSRHLRYRSDATAKQRQRIRL